MVDAVLQNVWVLYYINKDEGDESLPLLACSFSDRSHVGIQNVPSDICCEVAYYQVPSIKQGMCKVYKNDF